MDRLAGLRTERGTDGANDGTAMARVRAKRGRIRGISEEQCSPRKFKAGLRSGKGSAVRSALRVVHVQHGGGAQSMMRISIQLARGEKDGSSGIRRVSFCV